jgi:hypothetical protein
MTDDPNHDPDAIIQRVLGPLVHTDTAEYVRKGSRRAVLVLDDSVSFLAPALRVANFWAFRAPPGVTLADFAMRDILLARRILITRNAPDYLDDAPVLDFAIIGLDALPEVFTSDTYLGSATVKMLSRAVTRHRLASRPPAWITMLVPEGEHVFVTLE